MFQTIRDFEAEWQNESFATSRVLGTLTDACLSQRVAPEHRSLGQLGWHIVTSIHEMLSRTGLQFQSPGDDYRVPETAEAIRDGYRRTSDAVLESLRTQWTDETLQEECNMYGEMWPNGLTLRLLVKHEIHHRAQMTVLLRQAGLRVPDIYGPVREDWLARGMALPTV